MVTVYWPYNYHMAFRVGLKQLSTDHDRKVYKVDQLVEGTLSSSLVYSNTRVVFYLYSIRLKSLQSISSTSTVNFLNTEENKRVLGTVHTRRQKPIGLAQRFIKYV